ncbi:MAG: hypothetical protein ACRD8O_12440, partial [Bryobacteraceae bacterium]
GDERGRRRWARHGSTRWLWKDQDVREAIRYVAEEQGKPRAVFLGERVVRRANRSLTLAAQLQVAPYVAHLTPTTTLTSCRQCETL